jgi:hypothetical protein
MISTGVFVALEASPFQVIRDLGELGKCSLEIFNNRAAREESEMEP